MSLPNTAPEDLANKILSALEERPGQRARDLATQLGVDRKTVNQVLAYTLAGRAEQDSDYRWSLRQPISKNGINRAIKTSVVYNNNFFYRYARWLFRIYLNRSNNNDCCAFRIFSMDNFRRKYLLYNRRRFNRYYYYI